MESNTASTGRSAPYGRACVNCARAKCKCIIRGVGASCERCHRLNKQCLQSPPVRKHRSRTAASQTTRLEEKLDGLVSLLKTATRATPSIESATAAVGWNFSDVTAQVNVPTPSNVSDEMSMEGTSNAVSNRILSPLTPGSVSAAPPLFPYTIPPDLEPSLEEAEVCLTTFRTQTLNYFPLMYIPENTTSHQLRQERPFLWLCIMAVSSRNGSKMLGLSREVRRIASQEILVDAARNVDLLLGLLVFIAWGQYQAAPLSTALIHLCLSLMFDLGLHRPVQDELNKTLRCLQYHHPKIRVPPTRTMEHRRAVLACYLLSSSIASFQRKFDEMRWTPYLEECLQILVETREYPTDEVFVCMIRLQRIVETAASICVRNREIEQAETLRGSLLYLKALKMQLQDVKSKTPPHLANNEILMLQMLSTEAIIHEIALSRVPLVPVGSGSEFQTLEHLYTCLQSIKAWFDVFFEFPPSSYGSLSMPTLAQFGYCIFALYRLSTLSDPAWDTQIVRGVADFPLILDRVINNMNQAKGAWRWKIGHDDEHLTKPISVLDMLKSRWESRADLDSSVAASMGPGQPPAEEQQLPTEGVFPSVDDDEWLKDILGLWDL